MEKLSLCDYPLVFLVISAISPNRQTVPVVVGMLLTKHSQRSLVPSCHENMTTLWEGYSLLYVEGNGRSHPQDLGSAGSCVQRFNTMPFTSCNVNNVCHYASRNDKSHWLATAAPATNQPIRETEIYHYISRCVVCDAESHVLVVHSQTLETPGCPIYYTGLWIGYSFLMYTGEERSGGGQDLSGPGSCLEDFRATPFIECNGAQGTCFFFPDQHSFWLTTISAHQLFQTPISETLSSGDMGSRVSRCQVCIKRNS